MPMSKQSGQYRAQAKDAGARAKTALSDEEGHVQRKRQCALNELAENETWLDGDRKDRPKA